MVTLCAIFFEFETCVHLYCVHSPILSSIPSDETTGSYSSWKTFLILGGPKFLILLISEGHYSVSVWTGVFLLQFQFQLHKKLQSFLSSKTSCVHVARAVQKLQSF